MNCHRRLEPSIKVVGDGAAGFQVKFVDLVKALGLVACPTPILAGHHWRQVSKVESIYETPPFRNVPSQIHSAYRANITSTDPLYLAS